jgi:hypothetical protein
MPEQLRKRRKLLPVLAAPVAIVGVPNVNEHRASAGAILTEPGRRFPNWEAPDAFQGPVARAECGPGSRPETGMQGEVSVADRESGRSSLGYSCNMDEVGRYGPDDPRGFEGAEWQLARYKDCAYYSQRLFPEPRSVKPLQERQGTIIVDVSNPEDPKFVKNLFTPGMMDPWETLKVNQARGLLAAVNVKGSSTQSPSWASAPRWPSREPAPTASTTSSAGRSRAAGGASSALHSVFSAA